MDSFGHLFLILDLCEPCCIIEHCTNKLYQQLNDNVGLYLLNGTIHKFCDNAYYSPLIREVVRMEQGSRWVKFLRRKNRGPMQ